MKSGVEQPSQLKLHISLSSCGSREDKEAALPELSYFPKIVQY